MSTAAKKSKRAATEGRDCEVPSISLQRHPRRPDVGWTSVSFACGGWLQFYMFGVARALQHCEVEKELFTRGAQQEHSQHLESHLEEILMVCLS